MTDRSQETSSGRVSILTDLYIDFLGSLVPGLFTIVLAGGVLFASAFVLCQSCSSRASSVASGPVATPQSSHKESPDFWLGPYGTTVIALVLAYVMGSVFYRQDPKVPDARSARLIWRKTKSKEDRERLAVQPTSEHFEDITPYDAQFPYFFLHEYLTGRGLQHLAQLVPWKGRYPDTWKYRTKMFINLLKIRLQFSVPEKCKEIVRNEAHVRMATSVWYATNWVMVASVVGLAFLLIASVRRLLGGVDHMLLGAFALDLVVLLIAVVMRFKIERFLHYLRVREVVYVLETAHFAMVNGVDLRISELTKGPAPKQGGANDRDDHSASA